MSYIGYRRHAWRAATCALIICMAASTVSRAEESPAPVAAERSKVLVAQAAGATTEAGTKTTADGVFTEAQAEGVEGLYGRSCAGCHGETLGGGASAPPLSGFPFVSYWGGKSLADLMDVLHTMPADNPGSLTDQQYADLMALILKTNGYPAGDEELPADGDQLAGITIAKPAR